MTLIVGVLEPGVPQPTSEFVLRAPNPGWWRKETQGLYWFRQSRPYVQFESVGDFIPEPRCLKFAVGL